jgi:hypothetical protein
MVKDFEADLSPNSGSVSRRARSMVREIGLAVALTAAAGASIWGVTFHSPTEKVSMASGNASPEKSETP